MMTAPSSHFSLIRYFSDDSPDPMSGDCLDGSSRLVVGLSFAVVDGWIRIARIRNMSIFQNPICCLFETISNIIKFPVGTCLRKADNIALAFVHIGKALRPFASIIIAVLQTVDVLKKIDEKF